jgi:hypothetical protein
MIGLPASTATSRSEVVRAMQNVVVISRDATEEEIAAVVLALYARRRQARQHARAERPKRRLPPARAGRGARAWDAQRGSSAR